MRSRRRTRSLLAAAALLLCAGCSEPLAAPGTPTTDPSDMAPATGAATGAATTTAPPSADPATTDPPATDPPATDPPAIDPGPAVPVVGELVWEPVADGVDRARLAVPLDHDDPDGEQIELAIARHRATDPARRIGVLFVNPGGPGAGATVLAEQARFVYGSALTEVFDIVAIDPRGTGGSEPNVDCVDDLDPVLALDAGPDDAAEEAQVRAAAARFAAACVERSGALLAHVDTVAAARDVDLVRRALGEERASWFGWSYGTELGATWATLFPDTVRTAVLDGAVDPTLGRVDELVQQAAGFESALTAFVDWCSADGDCELGRDGDAAAAFADAAAAAERGTVPTDEGRPALSEGLFDLAVVSALYSSDAWPLLARALADVRAGDGSLLLQFFDGYTGRLPGGGHTDEIEAYFAVSCADDPTSGDTTAIADAERRRRDVDAASPRVGTPIAFELLVCASFPPGTFGRTDDRVEVTASGAGPVLVIGNTGDPATPIEGSRRMAEQLEDAVFVEVVADAHTAYGLNGCIDTVVERWLVQLEVPTERRC